MLELVSWNYWWPGLSRYVAKFVGGCDACNWTKTFPTQKVGKLIPNKVPDQHWQVISIDMIRELPDSKGYNATLVVVDCLSKQIHAIPTVTSLDSTGVAWLFLEHIWCHHGLPEEVISDHGPAFVSNFSHDLATLLSWYDLPSPSLPASSRLQPHPPPLHLFHLCSAPTLMCTCATCMTMLHPLLD